MGRLSEKDEQHRYDDAIQCLGETARELTKAKRRIKVLEKEQVALTSAANGFADRLDAERKGIPTPETPALRPDQVLLCDDYEVWEHTMEGMARRFRVEPGIKFDGSKWKKLHDAPCEPKHWALGRILK